MSSDNITQSHLAMTMLSAANLTEREKEIIRYRFGLDGRDVRTLQEIEAVFGVDKDTVRSIEAKALNIMEGPYFESQLKKIEKKEAKDKLRVFISYSRADHQQAKTIYDQLLKYNCSPWMDKEDLLPGEEWADVVSWTVSSSDIFVICLSENSVGKRGFVQKEIGIALSIAEEIPEGNIFIIPIKLDKCEIPRRLAKFNWLEMFNSGMRPLISALAQQAKKLEKQDVVCHAIQLADTETNYTVNASNVDRR